MVKLVTDPNAPPGKNMGAMVNFSSPSVGGDQLGGEGEDVPRESEDERCGASVGAEDSEEPVAARGGWGVRTANSLGGARGMRR
eukprot:CAMPEP_0185910284 /NCGR_PEP_ID=MMETSP0196C-20130402/18413_1 /TAXON_ID=2932 /ORGANISM="Alexandrium fundyense, Strain CCMP1719" /LENGTH=83 /DNA_ID=CAMNT_0028630995 /DNA_START=42 /DNA_END=289 /DNA_ORIENTATION=-